MDELYEAIIDELMADDGDEEAMRIISTRRILEDELD